MRRSERRTLASSFWAVLLPALGLVAGACRSPTQILLKIRTNAPCTNSAEWKGVAVYVGEPGAALEKNAPTLVTTECDAQGQIGSVVVAPSGDKDERIGVRVVAGLLRNPEECEEANYAGCIVARRTLRYAPHDPLELEVALLLDCESQACDPEHTCLTGSCIDSQVISPPPAAPTSLPQAQSVRCGDYGVTCATSGDVCCLTVDVPQGKAQGQCRPAIDCPSDSIVLNCDDDSDCASTAGNDVRCLLSYDSTPEDNTFWTPISISLSACLPTPTIPALALCQDRSPCGSIACRSSRGVGGDNLLPGYFWCEFGDH